MTRTEIIEAIKKMRRTLAQPLPADEYAAGWTDRCRLDMQRYFEKLETDLARGAVIPFFSIGRALDHHGVGGGNLLEEACRISNAVNALVERKP